MSRNPDSGQNQLARLYRHRFAGQAEYRNRVWQVLCRSFFAPRFIPASSRILDLGCGFGEFVNNIDGSAKYAMDLNLDSPSYLAANVHFVAHDCACPWPFEDGSFNVVFTSNFFEHLLCKEALLATIKEAARCLAPAGRIIALGPNIHCLPGAYWDFWDHHIPLTEQALAELFAVVGLAPDVVIPRFLPYTMSAVFTPPMICLRLYLRLPFFWRFFGKQFLVSGVKTHKINTVVGG